MEQTIETCYGKMTIEELVKQNRGAQAMVIDDIGDRDEIAKNTVLIMLLCRLR